MSFLSRRNFLKGSTVNNAHPTAAGQSKLARGCYGKNSIPLGEIDLFILNGGIDDLNDHGNF